LLENIDLARILFGEVTPLRRDARYVLRGTLNSQLNSDPVGTFGPGASWFEPPSTLHTFIANPSTTEAAQVMAIFVADSDCGKLTIFEDE